MQRDLPKTIGRYQVLGLLGRGGMGVVYRGRDLSIDRPVAIKVLGVDQDSLRDRFLQEARSAGKLHHPNIVTIYEYGEHLGDPFIAMEFVDGLTMAQLIASRGRLDVGPALHYIRQIALALGYAHDNDVVHRDIKPANVIVAGDSLKILDFGIARMSDSSLTHAGATVGTPNYMSPEQVSGKLVDRRCDVFSVGVVLYELLSGVQAFPGQGVHMVMHAVCNEAPVSLTEILPELDPRIAAIVTRAIEKDPNRRFSTMADFLHELDVVEAAARYPGATDVVRSGSRHEALARKRRDAIETQYREALRLFEEGKFAESVEACEQAAILDTGEVRVLGLLDRAKVALDRQDAEWLAGARWYLEEEDTEHASELVDRVLVRNPQSIEALRIQAGVNEIRQRRHSDELQKAMTGADLLSDPAEVPPLAVTSAPTVPTPAPFMPPTVPTPAPFMPATVPTPAPVPPAVPPGNQAAPAVDRFSGTTPDGLEPVAPQHLMDGRKWLLVPPDLLPERDHVFKPRPPKAKQGPAVFHDVVARDGGRDWFAEDPSLKPTKAASPVSVGVSLVVHTVAALVVLALLAQTVQPPPKIEPITVILNPPPPVLPPPPPPKLAAPKPRAPQQTTPVKSTPAQSTAPQSTATPSAQPVSAPAPIEPPTRTVLTVSAVPPVTSNQINLAPPPPLPPGYDDTPVAKYDTPPVMTRAPRAKQLPVGVKGLVKVRFIVTRAGVVDRLSFVTQTPYEQILHAAILEMKFEPARVGGRAVAVWVDLTIDLETIK